MIHMWVEAIRRKEPGVNVHQPPSSVIDLLTVERSNRSAITNNKESDNNNRASGIVNNIYYGHRPETAASFSSQRPATALPSSSPFQVSDPRPAPDTLLHEYGFWLEYRCDSQHWRNEIRKAIALCNAECLMLDYAMKMPLTWWEERHIKVGIARMLCDNVKKWRNWRTAQAGKIRKVQVSDNEYYLATDKEYSVITVDIPKEKPADSSTSLQLPDVHSDESLAISDNGLHNPAYEEDFSEYLQQVADFNAEHYPDKGIN